MVGGRLDALTGRSVAALVYTRRKHYVNVSYGRLKTSTRRIHPPGSRRDTTGCTGGTRDGICRSV